MHKPAVGHIYVLETTGGIIKVGYSSSPQVRMMAHSGAAKKKGDPITQRWISPEHVEAGVNEETLIDLCGSLGGQRHGSRERFSGLHFADVVDAAERLPFTAPTGIKTFSACDVRLKLRDVLSAVERGEHVQIERYGTPTAVALSPDWYEHAKAVLGEPVPDFTPVREKKTGEKR